MALLTAEKSRASSTAQTLATRARRRARIWYELRSFSLTYAFWTVVVFVQALVDRAVTAVAIL